MSSWVITIAVADHWPIALREGLWDLPKHFTIASGDLVYFRGSGENAPLLGQVRVLGEARRLSESDETPWTDDRERYRSRFTFQVISTDVIAPARWKDISPRLRQRPTLQAPREFDSAQDEEVLASLFATPLEQVVAQWIETGADEPNFDTIKLQNLTTDQRKFVEAVRVQREGQDRFRKALLSIYGRCAVTGTRAEATLDAAHISPYKGQQSNEVRNGLILRKDIHRLFDLDLLALDDDGTIRVAPKVSEPIYRELDGRTALLPDDVSSRPDPAVLKEHRAKCTWLAAAAAEPATVVNDHVLF